MVYHAITPYIGIGNIDNRVPSDGASKFKKTLFKITQYTEVKIGYRFIKKEAENIARIVASFKRSMLPGGTQTEGGSENTIDSSYWTFPDMFTIDFFINGNKFPRMNIYRSVLKAMSVDFAGSESQVAFHPGGEPVGTILNLTFQETIHVTNADIAK